MTPDESGWKTTLSEIWNREDLAADQGRIIITYNADAYTDTNFFFNEVLERWGDKDKAEDLYNYINNEVISIPLNWSQSFKRTL